MGGLALIKALHRENPNLKAIAITGYGGTETDVTAAHRSGIQEIVHKPLEAASLAQVVRRALDNQSPG